ncbi:MAG: serine hydrolase domain-containing protein [Bryobacteraceae bacterium]
MKRILAALSVAICLLAQNGGRAGMDSERLAKIAPRMKSFVDRGQVAGTVTLVARHGQIVEFDAVGYQDSESRKPMAKDSIFQIMSMTKPMVGTAIMMLADEGRLAVVDPVEKYLPEFRGQMMIASRGADGTLTLRKPARPITIRDLMSHTSGMPGNPPAGLTGLYQKMDRTLADATLIYSQMPLEFEPGTEWRYSNPGIATLGRIIEVVSDQPFEKFMAERLWQPLGMKDTFIFPPDDKKPRIAAVHATRDGKLMHADGTILGGDALEYRKGAKYSAPEFGAYSTAQDLLAFYEMTRNWGIHGGKRLLSKAAIETMTRLHTADIKSGHMPGTGFGLTWEVVRENYGMLNYLSIGAYGHGGAFGTHGWIDRKQDMVGVYLVQGGAGNTDAKYAFMRMANAAVVE